MPTNPNPIIPVFKAALVEERDQPKQVFANCNEMLAESNRWRYGKVQLSGQGTFAANTTQDVSWDMGLALDPDMVVTISPRGSDIGLIPAGITWGPCYTVAGGSGTLLKCRFANVTAGPVTLGSSNGTITFMYMGVLPKFTWASTVFPPV